MEIWLIYAVLAAVFAALTTILAKIGIGSVDSHLATAIRTGVVVAFAWLMVLITGSGGGFAYISGTTWVFLILSGLATGGSWLCFFHALKLGDVNKVVPIDKSSTILTMLLAFIFLGEPVGVVMGIGMVLMGIGTWLMLEIKKDNQKAEKGRGWLFFAVLSAVFAALVAIFGKIGVADMDANLWTALRTMVVLPLAWLMVFKAGNQKAAKAIDGKSWLFLILSGVATGASWLFFYHALKTGSASHVVPIDKLSILLTMAFARIFLGERFTRKSLLGLALLTVGTLMPLFFY
ncbi:MAG: EamA family transporter [Defluviitaleaceae bacterium]|nr:EamA family transporter [Defluviitaleaceae bacterium]